MRKAEKVSRVVIYSYSMDSCTAGSIQKGKKVVVATMQIYYLVM